jgi:hypothetical protein
MRLGDGNRDAIRTETGDGNRDAISLSMNLTAGLNPRH